MPALRPVIIGLLLAAPFAASAYGAASLVGPVSLGTARVLLALVSPLTAPEPLRALEPPSSDEAMAVAPTSAPVSGAAPGGPARRAPRRAAPGGKPAALFVSQTTVLKLARSAARPRGAFVAGTAEHPAGLRLADVGALGIGVQDGDILVEALGITPRAPGDIIGAVLQARAKNARFLSGTLWRGGDTFQITVEQPYLPAEG